LYPELVSGSAFTVPRAKNRYSWLYRIRPSVQHAPDRGSAYQPWAHPTWVSPPFRHPVPPVQFRFRPQPPRPAAGTDFVDGTLTVAANGSGPSSQDGCSANTYAANASMSAKGRFLRNSDADMLILPQDGTLVLRTELGTLQGGRFLDNVSSYVHYLIAVQCSGSLRVRIPADVIFTSAPPLPVVVGFKSERQSGERYANKSVAEMLKDDGVRAHLLPQEGTWQLLATADGKAYVSNGTTAKWAEGFFPAAEEHVPPPSPTGSGALVNSFDSSFSEDFSPGKREFVSHVIKRVPAAIAVIEEMQQLHAEAVSILQTMQDMVLYFLENFGDHFVVPDLGGLFRSEIRRSPLDVVAWYGNLVPCKYDMRLFNAINTVTYDHPDPSINTVLSSYTSTPGLANLDFVIFPPRWVPAEGTFRPPWFHRNCMSEFMGLLQGTYDAKPD
ncbi:unnamed protein product, partial [Polarella glacialis]